MLSAIVIYAAFLAICGAALYRPWLGVVGFYFFAVLDPGWNWRWAIDPLFPFQKYIFVCIVLGWLLNSFPGLKYRGTDAVPMLSLIGFLGLAFVSGLQTIDEQLSSVYLSSLWKIILLAVIAAMTLDTPKKLATLLFAVVIAQGYNAYQINLQYFQDGFSQYAYITNWGSKGDNNVYSILTIPVLAMSMALAATEIKARYRLLALGIAVLQIHQLMLLESRGSMLGALGMFAVFGYFVPKNKTNLTVIGCLILAGVLLAGPSVIDEFSSAFAGADERDSSAESRFHLWSAGWKITMEYPVLGVGPWCGSLLVPKYYLDGLSNASRKELHNLLFELTTGTGIPATVLYLTFFLVPWWRSVKALTASVEVSVQDSLLRATLLAVACGIPGYFFASMFSSGALLETSYILAASGCAATMITKRTLIDASDDELHEGITVTL